MLHVFVIRFCNVLVCYMLCVIFAFITGHIVDMTSNKASRICCYEE